MIRILIVDDSPTIRLLLRIIFESDPELSVTGEARTGEEALSLCVSLQPDIVTMDINMPGMDGYEAIRQIMSESPRPIIVLTSIDSSKLLDVSFKALSLGALSVAATPGRGPGTEQEAQNLIAEVKTMAAVKVVRRPLWLQRNHTKNTSGTPGLGQVGRVTAAPANGDPSQLVTIGVSTGGPPALQTILNGLPHGFCVPILIVQHISRGFVSGLASWLSSTTPVCCCVAEQDQVLQAGTAYLAPDDTHMTIRRPGVINLDSSAPVDGHRPAVTALFESAAASYGSSAIGILLTGMGQDGARGLLALRRAGAYTIAQDEASSVVFGMPKVAYEMGGVVEQLSLYQIADKLITLTLSSSERERGTLNNHG
jgi:two-component system chemotaxis response regulator CheB